MELAVCADCVPCVGAHCCGPHSTHSHAPWRLQLLLLLRNNMLPYIPFATYAQILPMSPTRMKCRMEKCLVLLILAAHTATAPPLLVSAYPIRQRL